jgi:hypothetical protein
MTRLLLIGLVAVALAGCGARGDVDLVYVDGALQGLPDGGHIYIAKHNGAGWFINIETALVDIDTRIESGTFREAMARAVNKYNCAVRARRCDQCCDSCEEERPLPTAMDELPEMETLPNGHVVFYSAWPDPSDTMSYTGAPK